MPDPHSDEDLKPAPDLLAALKKTLEDRKTSSKGGGKMSKAKSG